MPSPFPGMDPYLEASGLWEEVHLRLIYVVSAQLNGQLPAGFVTRVEATVRIDEANARMRPDAMVTAANRPQTRSGVALLEHPVTTERNPPTIVRTWDEPFPQRHLEIVALDRPDRVVTIIEILSSANKTAGRGGEEYHEKQQVLLSSSTHLLEIDLLRAGLETVAVAGVDELPASPYRICLHRAGRGHEYEVWSPSLREPLPEVRVPLTEAFADRYLDLQAVVERIYDDGFFQNKVDYSSEPVPPLTGDDALWAEALLRERGLRP